MQRALDSGDIETLRGEAHAIKGGAWNLSAIALGNAAAAVEDAASAGSEAGRERLDALYRSLLFEFERFTDYCRNHPELR